eukprot:13138486-Heterocapsa_arctica.AAC.1
MTPPSPDIDMILRSLPWEAISCHSYKRSSHVNIQELQETRKTLVERPEETGSSEDSERFGVQSRYRLLGQRPIVVVHAERCLAWNDGLAYFRPQSTGKLLGLLGVKHC